MSALTQPSLINYINVNYNFPLPELVDVGHILKAYICQSLLQLCHIHITGSTKLLKRRIFISQLGVNKAIQHHRVLWQRAAHFTE